MNAHIIKRQKADIQSASDVEIVDGIAYLVGDDSPYLYCLDHDWNLQRRVVLFASEHTGDRIPKEQKPDLEAMSVVYADNKPHLLIFGSGSRSPQRDVCYWVDLAAGVDGDLPVRRASLTPLYDRLRHDPLVVGSGKLNIEGAAATREHLILFQRGNISHKNVALYYDLPAFLAYLRDDTTLPPEPVIYAYGLPSLQGILSGFSGATLVPDSDQILFAAAVEDTTNELEDGPTLGSFLGLLRVEDGRTRRQDPTQPKKVALVRDVNGATYTGKIESVAVLGREGADEFTLLAATDDDRGGSELLLIHVK